MKTTEEMIAVMQAFADGKKIEYREEANSDWEEIEKPLWDWSIFDYRIKSESKYRPFKSAEEVTVAIRQHGGWIKAEYSICFIVEYNDTTVWLDSFYEFAEALQKGLTFLDGTPFGKLKE